MIDVLDNNEFMYHLGKSEELDGYSVSAMERFWNWMFEDEDGWVQVCAFPVPPKGLDRSDIGRGTWKHVKTFNEFKKFCKNYSDIWRYQVYAGVNTLDEKPENGRGSVNHIHKVNNIPLDIETERESYQGASREEVWWSYGYAMAQVKEIEETFGIWPMVVMSENGIHLHYKADLDVKDELLVGKQHVYTKYITHLAMKSKNVEFIEDRKPDRVEFDQDDVSDIPRVMKVPGTKGIKSETGRMCGIVHEPDKQKAGVLTEDEMDISPGDIKSALMDSDNSSISVTVSVADSDSLDDSVETRIESLAKNDDGFRRYWEGDIADYKSRSEAEFGFILKLLNHGFSEEEIVKIMFASGMSKWDEETNHYRRRTLENAMEQFDGSVVKDSTNGSYSFSRVS